MLFAKMQPIVGTHVQKNTHIDTHKHIYRNATFDATFPWRVSCSPKIAISYSQDVCGIVQGDISSQHAISYIPWQRITVFVLEYKWVWFAAMNHSPAHGYHPETISTMYRHTTDITNIFRKRRKHIPFFALPPPMGGRHTKPLMNKPICGWLTSLPHSEEDQKMLKSGIGTRIRGATAN